MLATNLVNAEPSLAATQPLNGVNQDPYVVNLAAEQAEKAAAAITRKWNFIAQALGGPSKSTVVRQSVGTTIQKDQVKMARAFAEIELLQELGLRQRQKDQKMQDGDS